MNGCLEREDLRRLARDGAGAAERQHVASCARCRTRLERLRRDGALFEELRAAAQSGAAAPGPAERVQPAARGSDAEHAGVAELAPRVPGYTLERELLRGGQGVVYAARQDATRRACAVKLLAGARTARERRRFELEIELACRLRHPGIVTVYESGETRGVPWFAMELVDGRPLDAWAREARPDLRARVELCARIAAAVAYAHRRGVIHRDLKPANVMVDGDGRPRILDFGAALDAAAGAGALRVTAPGEFLGTLAYAAPEQLAGDGSEVDTRTDVHALGVLLYELLAGKPPFEVEGGVSELVRVVATRTPERPSQCAEDVDADLDAIALTALEKDPARRYPSAAALARDLEHWLAGRPIEARAAGAWYRLRKLVARRRGAFAAAAAVAALGLSSAAAWWNEHQRAERQREQVALVRAVFQDILSAAAPQRMGADVRLLEVLELAARTIDDTLRDAPDVQGAMELTIGDTYRKLLRPAEAVPHLRRALERYAAAGGASELDVARCANVLGLALSDLNEPEAIRVQERALAIRAAELDADAPLVAESERNLAIALLCQFKDVDQRRAGELLARAERAFLASGGADDPDLAETRLWQAHAVLAEDAAAALALLDRAREALERRAPDDPRLIAVLNASASAAQHLREFERARALLERSSELTRELYGDALATDLLRRHARLAFAQGDAATAEQLSRRALAHELVRWSGKRPEQGARLRSLALRVEAPGSPAAEPPWPEAFAALRELEGDGSFELAQWMNGIAAMLVELGRGRAVPPLLEEALKIRCRALGVDCPVRLRTIELLAQELLAEGRGADAVAALRESLATFARLGEAGSGPGLRAAELLAACSACPDGGGAGR